MEKEPLTNSEILNLIKEYNTYGDTIRHNLERRLLEIVNQVSHCFWRKCTMIYRIEIENDPLDLFYCNSLHFKEQEDMDDNVFVFEARSVPVNENEINPWLTNLYFEYIKTIPLSFLQLQDSEIEERVNEYILDCLKSNYIPTEYPDPNAK